MNQLSHHLSTHLLPELLAFYVATCLPVGKVRSLVPEAEPKSLQFLVCSVSHGVSFPPLPTPAWGAGSHCCRSYRIPCPAARSETFLFNINMPLCWMPRLLLIKQASEPLRNILKENIPADPMERAKYHTVFLWGCSNGVGKGAAEEGTRNMTRDRLTGHS
ncbi:hypothetical protein Nmel_002201 [Mimus melanotis]